MPILKEADELTKFVLEHNVDEIYCSLNEITNEQLKDWSILLMTIANRKVYTRHKEIFLRAKDGIL